MTSLMITLERIMKSFKTRYDARKAAKLFKAKFEKFQKEKEWKDDAAEIVIKNIKGFTRKQKSTSTGEPLKKIKTSTEKDKKRWGERNTPGTLFGAKKSNLTRSGQLLESLERVEHKERIEITATGNRKAYKGEKNPPTNKELLGYLREKGFTFLGVNKSLKKIINKKLLSHLRRSVLRK